MALKKLAGANILAVALVVALAAILRLWDLAGFPPPPPTRAFTWSSPGISSGASSDSLTCRACS